MPLFIFCKGNRANRAGSTTLHYTHLHSHTLTGAAAAAGEEHGAKAAMLLTYCCPDITSLFEQLRHYLLKRDEALTIEHHKALR